MGYQYLLFDLDGTLTDPKEGITRCFQYALESFGIHAPDADKLTWVIGPPLVDSFMEGYGFTLEQAKQGTAKYRERYTPIGWKENEAYPGIAQALRTLKEAGFVLATATSKPEDMARKILEHFGLLEYFSFVGGASLDLSRCGKADVIRYTLDNLGVKDCGKVLMVGDRKYDVEGAKEFGIPCLGVLYGYGNREELTQAGATALVEDTEELCAWCMAHRAGGL
ncbi:MAG: HAD family hydrolase [Lachnospiraceae bacterium]|nr:HAD family hydrolase [Lachnospiraceae bacterium]